MFLRSRPSRALWIATVTVIVVTVAIPWTPVATTFGFETLPRNYLWAIAGIVALYVLAADMAKPAFYRWCDKLL
jgi:Mg2+-importing ATPase